MKKLLVVVLVMAAAVIGWGVLRKNQPPKAAFARVARQNLVSTLSTNGKGEPFEWQAVRAEIGGLVTKVGAKEGQAVAQGAVVADVSDPSLQADIDAAQAKVAEASANLSALEAGGKPAELAQIDADTARARLNLQQEQRNYDSLRRLQEKQAATPVEVAAASARLQQFQLEIEGLAKRRTSLVAKTDVSAARARLQDAETALRLAEKRAVQSTVRAPISGVVYQLSVRPGDYVKPGDLLATIGRLDRLRVRVYVDEPELGRVHEGDPVVITWDALPDQRWQGSVERKPASIQALGSRQVGEVVCTIENPGRELTAGANVNAEIRTAVAQNALVVPKEALRHDAGGDYVYLLAGDHIERRPVKPGISSVTQVQIVSGLAEGDQVALPTEVPLKPGQRVSPA
ncbi:MAG: efflux RND transporter periplasmic adaptor subunit [Acidobacteriia bacterium]|nr:efflux RND transporter periplasmic adaptor subunit [Terriglobia bacterium]